MSNYSPTRDTLAKRIAGEIVLSPIPGQTMRKWRELLSVNQIEVAEVLDLSPSVISDYETGRRKSPGAGFIKRYVETLLDIDESRGGHYIRQLSRITLDPSDVFIDIREFMAPVVIQEIIDAVDGELYTCHDQVEADVFGYTIVDSIKAIMMLSGLDFYRIFGTTSERALVFTGVSRGRSPMIAVKISPFKPRIIVLHGIREGIDPLAIRLAEHEGIPLVVSKLETEDKLVESLMDLYESTE
ncbi:helix-turn-helix domain-containing protein [Candidatus Bathyarchaeota archaeon]|jgi:putative transcriptional regulator|nr:helix-turn-helix domain-containing protein [Candidatus Bathyarchaeota archaeon]